MADGFEIRPTVPTWERVPPKQRRTHKQEERRERRKKPLRDDDESPSGDNDGHIDEYA